MMNQLRKQPLRMLAFLLAFVLSISLFPAAGASGDTQFTEEGLGYTVIQDQNGDSYVEITGYTGTEPELVIPSRIQELPVCSVAAYAFEDCTVLTDVTLPDSVTEIGDYAFLDCTNLVRAVLPEGITSLDYTFVGCSSLSDVVIPESVTRIGKLAFSLCSSLADITIPDAVTVIDFCAFNRCTSLTSIRLPKNVEDVDSDAFPRCTNLTAFLVDEENMVYSSRDGVLYNKEQTTLVLAPSGLSGCYTVPDGVTTIDDYAFSTLTGLTGIVLPDTLTTIGNWAFFYCTALADIVLPQSVTSIGQCAFYGCSTLTEIRIPWNVTRINAYTFTRCTSLTAIEIPTSVKKISDGAFSYCTALETVSFLGNAPTISYDAFEHVNAVCYYSEDYEGWTEEVLGSYGGALTWIPSDEIHVHEYRVDVTPPGCLTWGYTTCSCDCGYSYVCDKIFFTGHSMGPWTVHAQATCTRRGEERSVCGSCDYYESRLIEMAEHVFSNDICQVCGRDTESATQIVDVTDYSYTITPILSPFAYYLYVQTDNPDPRSFRLVDRDSAYYDEEDTGSIRIPSENGYYSTETEPGTYYISQSLYPDAVYEDPSIHRVPGGYIFLAHEAYSDGGEFLLLQQTVVGSTILRDQFRDTDVVIPCQKLYTRLPYLIEHCTDPELELFENLDQVDSFLKRYAVYPRYVYDANKPNGDRRYPFLTSSYWPELPLDPRYSIFEELDSGLLMMAAYPFILDSLGYPGTIGAVAAELAPSCTVDSTGLHYEVQITHNGESHTYGGAGRGGYDPLYSNRVEKAFTFTDSGCAANGTLDSFCQTLLDYEAVTIADNAQYADLIEGDTFTETIQNSGSTWVRVATEGGLGYGTSFAYLMWDGDSVRALSNAWVDGRYVGEREIIQLRASFEDHPTSKILLHDVTYTDSNGMTKTGDVLYKYDQDLDVWTSYDAYNGGWYDSDIVLPDALILTREEVDAMDLDANSARWPEGGLIYDGTAHPGTPFTHTSVTGVTLTESVTLRAGDEATLELQVFPDDADDTRVNWTVSDEAVVQLVNPETCRIRGLTEGTAQITATTVDGSYSAVCQVTVKKSADEVHNFTDISKGAFYYEPVLWAVENGIASGMTDTTFGPGLDCTRGQVVTFLWRAAGKPEPTTMDHPFTDVKEGAFYYKAMLWAVENGITQGTSATTFAPNLPCDRGTVVTFLHRAKGKPAPTTAEHPFTDVDRSRFYYEAMLWAVENGVTSGMTKTTFAPAAACTRGQVVTFLYRAFN